MLNKRSLLNKYWWLAPGADAYNLVIGDDLDSALSAVLYLYTHPNAQLVGIYSKYTTVAYSAAVSWQEVLDAVWLDLDIYDARCRSLGHHIVRLDSKQILSGFNNSLNLNDLWRKSLKHNFDEKYPLGTIHFLMWLYQKEIPNRPDADLLLWLADSAYINAQSNVYRKRKTGKGFEWTPRPGFKWNVKSWLHGAIQVKSLQHTFEHVGTRVFEERMQAFQQTMNHAGFVQGEGQVASHHLKLSGYQCQPTGDIGAFTLQLLDFCARTTDWTYTPDQVAPIAASRASDSLHDPIRLQAKSGVRATTRLDAIGKQGLENFLTTKHVFSYVFTHFDTLNYTANLA